MAELISSKSPPGEFGNEGIVGKEFCRLSAAMSKHAQIRRALINRAVLHELGKSCMHCDLSSIILSTAEGYRAP